MMNRILLATIKICIFANPLLSFGQQVYDHSLNKSVFERSSYHYKNNYYDKYESFLSAITPNTKIFVHMHGCAGIHGGDDNAADEYFKVGGSVIKIDFLQRPGVSSSCPDGKMGNNSEISNVNRINLRRSEAEVLVKDLQAKGFNNIYISGHSEGGRTASTWTIPVKGIIIHGMDCNIQGFWNIQKGQKTLVMFSLRDEWIVAQRASTTCRHFFNKEWVTEVSHKSDTSHNPFSTKLYIEEFKKWILEEKH